MSAFHPLAMTTGDTEQESESGATADNSSAKTVQDIALPAELISEPPPGFAIFFAILALFLAVVVYVFYRMLAPLGIPQVQLRRNYSRFELSDNKRQLALYRRHRASPSKTINICNLTRCELVLNERTLLTLQRGDTHPFSNVLEQALRDSFAQEYLHKMIPGRIRHIYLLLQVGQATSKVSLYMRVGDRRLTKTSYRQCIENLLDWCWFISSVFSNEPLEERIKADVASEPERSGGTTAAQKEALAQHAAQAASRTDSESSLARESQQLMPEEQATVPPGIVNASTHGRQDKELVDALEKLVRLKRQGVLTEHEFMAAKDKLMDDLLHG